MPSNQDALLRMWHLLSLLPRSPQQTTVQDLKRRLESAGFFITERTVQRDLLELSEFFPLYMDDRCKPFGWSWQRDAKSLSLPALTIDEALTWVMTEQHVRQMLPTSTLEQLQPYFASARQRLDRELPPHKGRSWVSKVRAVQPTQNLLPPHIDPDVQKVVSDALLHEQQILLSYRRKGEREAKEYQVHPLALIQRGTLLYLLCRLFDYTDTRLMVLHRIESAQLLDDQPAIAPDNFDLDEELAKGRLDFGSGERMPVKLKFSNGSGEHLFETPLSEDQKIEEGENTIVVTATIPSTPQLRWWLLGFGDRVEVLEPVSLRQEMHETAKRMLACYQT